jgi:hypothetical protein
MVSKKIREQIYNVVDRNVRRALYKTATDREISYGLFNHVHSKIHSQVCSEISVQVKENIVYEIRK